MTRTNKRWKKVDRGGTMGLCRYEVDACLRTLIRAARARGQSSTERDLSDAGDQSRPFVHETRYYKSLHFGASETQSRMLKRDPYALVVDYTRTMMGFLTFNPVPNRIAMIGLGGGSLAKFCYRELPRTQIDVVEINPYVVALRDDFFVPSDGDRFRIHLGDGTHFIGKAHRQFDVLLLDAYTRTGLPPRLGSAAFYRGCRRTLCDNGIMVLNLYCKDSDEHLDRLRAIFHGEVFVVDEVDGTNRVVFACNGNFLASDTSTVAPTLRHTAGELLRPELSRVRSAVREQLGAATIELGSHAAPR